MTSVSASRASGRPRLPGLANVAVVAVVVVLVAGVALTARQAPPPTVAEFAPQAVEQIEEALPEQADTVGDEGEGGGVTAPDASEEPAPTEAPDEVTPTEGTTEPDEIERPRARECVGNPPRQTQDPQSPPCVPYFDGDNGGATWQGVTADEIRVAYPVLDFFGREPTHLVNGMVDHFNKRYEFYGRKIVLVEYDRIAFGPPDPPEMIADAVKVDEEFQAFASLGYASRENSEHHYYDELARRGIVSVSAGVLSLGTEDRYNRFSPHEWTWGGSASMRFALTGDFICKTLAGKPPVGGTWVLEPETRVFGIIVTRAADGTIPDVSEVLGRMTGCGHPPAVYVEDDAANPQGPNIMQQMSEAGVTSVICLCAHAGVLRTNYMESASQRGYFPEWVVTGFGGDDVDNSFIAGQAPQEQARNVLGVTFHDRFLPRQQMPWYWAIREMMPDQDPTGGVYYTLAGRYLQLLNLASGIQMAGPELTPATFEQGLQNAVFPNPGAGTAPYYQAAIDFRGNHTARSSAALIWYSTTDNGVIQPEQPGAVCYLDGGTRYRLGEFPTEQQPFFQEPCIR